MEAESPMIRGIKILEVDNVKVYEVYNNQSEPTNLTRGKLLVFYFPEYDRFVLSLNSFEYALSPYLPTLASLTVDRGFRSYILPNVGGHYVLKLKTTPIPAVIKNFETILANYSQFSYEQGHEKELSDQANRKGDYNMNFESPYEGHQPLETAKPQPDNFVKAENAVSLSGEFLKQKFIKAANYIGGNYIQPKAQIVTEQNSNQFYVKNIQDLKGVSAIDNELVDFKRTLIVGLITLSNQIEKAGVTASTIIKPKTDNKQQSNWSELGTTTLNSAKNVWFGMSEAANILGKAWKAKKTAEGNNQKGKPVQYERVDPNGNRPNPFNNPQNPQYSQNPQYPQNTQYPQYPANQGGNYPREQVQVQAQEQKPYVFYEPKYTQAPVIERHEQQEYREFRDEGVSQGEQNLLENEDTGRRNLYPRLDNLNVEAYPAYNPYKIDSKPSDATYARIQETQGGNYQQYSESG